MKYLWIIILLILAIATVIVVVRSKASTKDNGKPEDNQTVDTGNYEGVTPDLSQFQQA